MPRAAGSVRGGSIAPVRRLRVQAQRSTRLALPRLVLGDFAELGLEGGVAMRIHPCALLVEPRRERRREHERRHFVRIALEVESEAAAAAGLRDDFGATGHEA